MLPGKISVRPANRQDISSINAIHAHYVENTVITFITEPNTDEATLETYQKTKDQGLPYLVVDGGGGRILGYAYVAPFRGVKAGYRHTLELSLFCHPDHVGKGYGKLLLTRMIEILKDPEQWRDWFDGSRLLDSPPKQLMAVMSVDVDGPGEGLKLRDWYLKFGFEQRGHLKEVGWKKERWVDTMYLQLALR